MEAINIVKFAQRGWLRTSVASPFPRSERAIIVKPSEHAGSVSEASEAKQMFW